MGKRAFSYAPTTYGYLLRKNAGIYEDEWVHNFDFAGLTTLDAAASIVWSFITANGFRDFLLSAATALLSPIINVNSAFSAKFHLTTYMWSYNVRLNSYRGQLLSSNFRTRDYWTMYNQATGARSYEYRGTAYDRGFRLSNWEMIKAAIDDYLA